MIVINVQGDFRNAISELERLGASTKFYKIDMLRAVGRASLAEVKRGYKKYLRQPTGGLYKSYKVKTNRKKGFAIVYSPTKQYIATAFERGSTIHSKKYKYLTYRVGDTWVKTKSITLPRAPFFSEGVASYQSGKLQGDIDKILEKAIVKFNKQAEGK